MDNLKDTGEPVDQAEVKISKRIIQLFSEGLYSSPNKAVEELVCNSFDAGAQHVHVVISDKLDAADATIAVIDDGESMDISGLQNHWIIGKSTRRRENPGTRKPIGKFGIGKLSTYILAGRLTHICRRANKKIHAVTMDYDQALSGGTEEEEIFKEKNVHLPIRELTAEEAAEILKPWLNKSRNGFEGMNLATKSWTVAIMSNLKEAGQKIQPGRLKWILRTAMPLRDDFKLYLNGESLSSSKIDRSPIKKWVLGKDITREGKLGDYGFQPSAVSPQKPEEYGLDHDILGRVTGSMELYDDELSGGKSDQIDRSNGFFVYVLGRMINTDDPGFGIARHVLHHGTFSRMRAVVHIDSLDEDLRSSRETLLDGARYTLAKKFMHELFNRARNELNDHGKKASPQKQLSDRITYAAQSLTRRPLLSTVEKALRGGYSPEYLKLPDCPDADSKEQAIQKFRKKIASDENLISNVEMVEIGNKKRWALYEVKSGILEINLSHPFVAFSQDVLQSPSNSIILEMLMIGEILQESYLYYEGYTQDQVEDIINNKDELLRALVRASGRNTAAMVSMQIKNSKNDPTELEKAVASAFDIMGFEEVKLMGKRNQPDGTAIAPLPATEDGQPQQYKIGLEAKSGGTVDAQRLAVSSIQRHMEKYHCDHHLVIGNNFSSCQNGSTMAKEILSFTHGKKRTITLITTDDFAKLVRHVPAKRIGLRKLQELFTSRVTPQESEEWVEKIAQEPMPDLHYKEILKAIWKLGKDRPSETIEYGTLANELSHWTPKIEISKQDVKDRCTGLQHMSKDGVYARERTVEINRRPDLILREIRETVDTYPGSEKETIRI